MRLAICPWDSTRLAIRTWDSMRLATSKNNSLISMMFRSRARISWWRASISAKASFAFWESAKIWKEIPRHRDVKVWQGIRSQVVLRLRRTTSAVCRCRSYFQSPHPSLVFHLQKRSMGDRWIMINGAENTRKNAHSAGHYPCQQSGTAALSGPCIFCGTVLLHCCSPPWSRPVFLLSYCAAFQRTKETLRYNTGRTIPRHDKDSNQPTDQSVNRSFSQTTNQPINQLINQSINQPDLYSRRLSKVFLMKSCWDWEWTHRPTCVLRIL